MENVGFDKIVILWWALLSQKGSKYTFVCLEI